MFVSELQDRAVPVILFSQALSRWAALKSRPMLLAEDAHGIGDDLSSFINSIVKNKK